MSEVLLARARAQGGVFASCDATAQGVTRNVVRAMVRDGTITRVAARAYVLSDTLRAARTPEAVHRLHTLAILRSFDGRVAASHHSALALHGLPFWRVPEDTFHVCRVAGTSSRVRGFLHIHESTTADPVVRLGPARALAVTPGLAAVGTAMVDGLEAGVVAMDAALHAELVTRADLQRLVDANALTPGVSRARDAVALADGSAESPGESRTRMVLRHLPSTVTVEPQAVILDRDHGFVGRSDFLVDGLVVVEFDGRAKYGLTGTAPEDLWAEKRREDRLRALGYAVVRLTWADLANPGAVCQRVLEALRLARVA
ncbi:hypothetical protein ACFUC1_06970 [Pedococcus sp. NPDC057267]|uniref:hypothetical protein n=1 Tax=Pedococcus sp. NPDC057267 TaxID=3346077 RepID=UPI00363C9162